MNDEAFEAKLKEVRDRIDSLPQAHREHLLELIEETRRRHLTIHETSRKSRELLDDWRLAAKYLLFDREASRREADQEGRDFDDQDR